MLLDNSRSSWIAAPDGLERKSAGAEDGSVSRLAWATITKDTRWADQTTEGYFLTYLLFLLTFFWNWTSKFKVLVRAPFLAFQPSFHYVHTWQRERGE